MEQKRGQRSRSLLRRKTKHSRNLARSGRLREPMQVGRETDDVATLVACCEVGPLSRSQVDLE
jgi:hypothetical protein